MSGEVEAKFWLSRPHPNLVKALGLEAVPFCDRDTLEQRAQEIAGEPEMHYLVDHYYIRTSMDHGYDLDDLAAITLEDDSIVYDGQQLSIAVSEGKDPKTEFDGFMGALRTFLSEDHIPGKYQIRLRTDSATGEHLMTLKLKHGLADEHTDEYEFQLADRSAASGFLAALGYHVMLDKTKSKKQARYSIHVGNTEVHIEFNTLYQLAAATLLEIEMVPLSLQESCGIDAVYDLAARLGVPEPRAIAEQGGNLERRSWQELMHIYDCYRVPGGGHWAWNAICGAFNALEGGAAGAVLGLLLGGAVALKGEDPNIGFYTWWGALIGGATDALYGLATGAPLPVLDKALGLFWRRRTRRAED